MFPPAFARRWRRRLPRKKIVDQVVRTELEGVVHGVAVITTEILAQPVEAGEEAAIETEAGEARLPLEIAGRVPVVVGVEGPMAVEALGIETGMEEAIALEVAAMVDMEAEAMAVVDTDKDGIITARTVRWRSFSRRPKTQQGSISTTMMKSQWRSVAFRNSLENTPSIDISSLGGVFLVPLYRLLLCGTLH
jgi:hypothetical protein